MAGLDAVRAAALTAAVRDAGRHADVTTAQESARAVLPVVAELSPLLPGRGLRRGSTVAVAACPGPPASRPGRAQGGSAPGGSSLMMALLAAASRSGAWCAVVGLPAF